MYELPDNPGQHEGRSQHPDDLVLFDMEQGSVADDASEEKEGGRTAQLPESLEHAKVRIFYADITRQAIENRELTPQEELGGGIKEKDETDFSKARPLDDAIRGSKEWMEDVYNAVEKYGLNQMTWRDFLSMTKKDQEQFARHFHKFFIHLPSRRQEIVHVEGDIEHSQFLKGVYGSDRTPGELLDYSNRLKVLIEGIHKTGIPNIVDEYLKGQNLSKNQMYNIKRLDPRDFQIEFVEKNGKKIPRKKTTA